MQSRENLAKKLAKYLERVQGHLRAGQTSAWFGLNLTMPQAKTLFLLAEGPRRMTGIAKRLNVEMPSATTMIDRLVKKKLVERKQDPNDRRVVVCSITATGLNAVEGFWSLRAAKIESLAANLSDEELETVVPALKILSDATRRSSSQHANGAREASNREEQTEEARV